MHLSTKLGAVAVIALLGTTAATATPIALTGNYIKVGISDRGTLGSNGSASPGLLHDPKGTRNFGVNDYLTPGSPHDGYSLFTNQGNGSADNNGASQAFGFRSPTLVTGSGNAASWSGSNGVANITNAYSFRDGDQRILVKTTITALKDLTGVAFSRSIDPDPDVNTFGSFSTVNQRGNSLFGIDDFVSGSGPRTGLTLALINLNGSTFAHSTQINSSCCSNINPFNVLNHTGGDTGLSSTGDYGLNLAYNIGDLANGNSVTLTYAYAVGDKVETTGSGTPEPETWALMLVGFGFVGATMRRRVKNVTFA